MEFVQAKHYRKGRYRPIRVIVWHDMEAPEDSTTAEDVAAYFARTTKLASANLCVDADSVVECVRETDTAWAAPGCNSDGYQVELAGYARQTRSEWMDPYSLAVIRRAAQAVAPRHGPPRDPGRWLTDLELADGVSKGMATHAQVSRVFRLSDHTDPGPGFPKDYAVAEVRAALAGLTTPDPRGSAISTAPPTVMHEEDTDMLVLAQVAGPDDRVFLVNVSRFMKIQIKDVGTVRALSAPPLSIPVVQWTGQNLEPFTTIDPAKFVLALAHIAEIDAKLTAALSRSDG